MFTLPSEAGHASFPMHGSDELAFASFLAERSRCTFITAEQVLSGRGLALLYEHCEGSAGLPEDFTCAAAFEASACCGFFARFYGRFCRMAALFLLPSAIVLAGGVAGKTPCLVHHPEFLREFLRPGSAAPALLESIPLALNRNSRSGLYGAAYAAWHLLERAAGRTA